MMIFISMKSEGKNTEMDKKDLKSLTFDELKMEIEGLGEKPFRAKQLYQWMHEKLASDFSEMTNLSQNFRQKLQEHYTYTSL